MPLMALMLDYARRVCLLNACVNGANVRAKMMMRNTGPTVVFLLLLLGGAATLENAAPSASVRQSGRPPNELGRIPIVMYHAVGGDAEFAGGPRYDRHGLNIAPETFRRQLAADVRGGLVPRQPVRHAFGRLASCRAAKPRSC